MIVRLVRFFGQCSATSASLIQPTPVKTFFILSISDNDVSAVKRISVIESRCNALTFPVIEM